MARTRLRSTALLLPSLLASLQVNCGAGLKYASRGSTGNGESPISAVVGAKSVNSNNSLAQNRSVNGFDAKHGAIIHTGSPGPILVDFNVFLGHDGTEGGVAPLASMNIGGSDGASGFYTMCKDACPTFTARHDEDTTVPEMRFCRCIAELLVEDLATDFGALLDGSGGPSGAVPQPLFALGAYSEIDAGQEFF